MKKEYFDGLIGLTRKRNELFKETNEKLATLQNELKEYMKDVPKDEGFTEEQDDEMYEEMERMQDILEEFYELL